MRKESGRLGPVMLAVLISAGQIKESPVLSWLPVDLTLLAAAAVAITAAAARQRGCEIRSSVPAG